MVSAASDVGNISVRMVREHMRDIPQASFPGGFSIRPMGRGEAGLWIDIQRDAERLMEIKENLFEKEFGSDFAATRERCFFIINARGVATGTISAWYSADYKGQDYGRIHWVAIREAYQGKGLARPALSHAMNYLAGRHKRAWLATSSARIPAIKLYLDYGFVPEMGVPNAAEAWEQVRGVLKHPVLMGLAV